MILDPAVRTQNFLTQIYLLITGAQPTLLSYRTLSERTVRTVKIVNEHPFGFEFECRGCKSQLVAEITDVKVGYFGANYGGDSPDREYYVSCLVCGTDRILKYNETTPKVREQANKTDRRRR